MTESSSSPTEVGAPLAATSDFDLQRYDEALGPLDLSESQRAELLAALWAIMQTLVHVNYSVSDFDLHRAVFGKSEVTDLEVPDADQS